MMKKEYVYERRSVVRNNIREVTQTSVLVCLILCTSPTPTHGSVKFGAVNCSFLVCFFISVAIILEILNRYFFFSFKVLPSIDIYLNLVFYFPFHHLNINPPDILGISSVPTFIIVKERLIKL